MNPRDVLLIRAEVAMWGAIATAGPLLIAGHKVVGLLFVLLGGAAWIVAKWSGGSDEHGR